MSEPNIQIDGRKLTDAQAMAVRVAVTSFAAETANPANAAEIGPIAGAYNARLNEVLRMMFKSIAQS